jgi:eukaryotic translation initiation factor 2C
MEAINHIKYSRDTDEIQYQNPSNLPARPGLNTAGKAIQVRVNQYKVTECTNKDIYQYDVSFSLSY